MDSLPTQAKTKTCTTCKTEKPVSEFYARGSGFYSYCKVCKRSQRRSLYQEQSATNINHVIHRLIKAADIIFDYELTRLEEASTELEKRIQLWQNRKSTAVP